MAERYQQDRLASSLVGTPGVDPSAGAVEAQIAEASNRATAAEATSRMQSLQQAESAFNTSRNQIFWANVERNRIRQAEEKIYQNERLQDAEAAVRQQLLDVLDQTQTEFAANPLDGRDAFKARVQEVFVNGIPQDFDQKTASTLRTRFDRLLPQAVSSYDSFARKAEAQHVKMRFTDRLQGYVQQAGRLKNQNYDSLRDLIGSVDAETNSVMALTPEGAEQIRGARKSVVENYFLGKLILDPDEGDVTKVNTNDLRNQLVDSIRDGFIDAKDATAILPKFVAVEKLQADAVKEQTEKVLDAEKAKALNVVNPFVLMKADELERPSTQARIEVAKQQIGQWIEIEQKGANNPDKISFYQERIRNLDTLARRGQGLEEKAQKAQIAAAKAQQSAAEKQERLADKQEKKLEKEAKEARDVLRDRPESLLAVSALQARVTALKPTSKDRHGSSAKLKTSYRQRATAQLAGLRDEASSLYAGGQGAATGAEFQAINREIDELTILLDPKASVETVSNNIRRAEAETQAIKQLEATTSNPVTRAERTKAFYANLGRARDMKAKGKLQLDDVTLINNALRMTK